MGRHLKDLAEALVVQEIRIFGRGATKEAIKAAIDAKINIALEGLVEKRKVTAEKGRLGVVDKTVNPVLRDLSGKPWFRFVSHGKENFLRVQAKRYIFCAHNFPVKGNWRKFINMMRTQGKMMVCSPPKFFADRTSEYYCWVDSDERLHKIHDYSITLKGTPFDYIDSRIAEAVMQEDKVSAVQLTGSRVPLKKINARFRAFERAGFIKQIDCADFHRGGFRPKWFVATERLQKIMEVGADEDDNLDFEDWED